MELLVAAIRFERREPIMTFLPIVERELRLSARRRSTYQIRLGAAVVAMTGSGWIFLGLADQMTPSQMGQALFIMLTTISFLYCLFVGVRATSDCVSEEKREGTLGLLFLTDLRGIDIILGKLAATSLSVIYALLAIMPVLSIPILLGGVSAGQFWRIVIVLLSTLILSLSIGILLSTYGWHGRRSALLGMAILFILNLAPPALGMYLSTVAGQRALEVNWMILSPGFAAVAAFDLYYAAWKNPFWMAVGVELCGGLVALAVASAAVPHQWQDRPVTRRGQSLRDRWKQWKLGTSTQRAEFRKRLLDINPILWLASRDRLRPAMVWGFLGLIGCGWVWGALKVGADWFDPVTYYSTSLLLCLSLKVWIGSEAARRFADERSAGALELLLSTPLTARELLHGHWLALRRQFFWPMVLTLAACLTMLVSMGLWFPTTGGGSTSITLAVAYLGLFVLDAYALAWTGFWQGLVAKKINRAGIKTFVLVMVLPAVIYIGASMAIGLLSIFLPFVRSSFSNELIPTYAWFLIGAINSTWLIVHGRSRLLHQLRRVASGHYGLIQAPAPFQAPAPPRSHPSKPPKIA